MTGCKFLHVSNVVIRLDPWAVAGIDIISKLLGLVTKSIPHGLDQYMYVKFLGERDDLADLFDRTIPDMLVVFVVPGYLTRYEEDGCCLLYTSDAADE